VATKKAKKELLGGVPIFQDLSAKDLDSILDSGKEVHHDAGHVVISEGHGGIGFHLILEGRAKVTRNGRTLARLGAGEFFGEMAVVDDGPRTASVVADTDLTTFFLSRWDFRPLVKSNPDLAWKLIKHLVGRLRDEQTGAAELTC
jgi:CRP/FNR family transcriptional regulator, cyclic AMP receptor protein